MSRRETSLLVLLIVLAVGLAFAAGFVSRDLVQRRTDTFPVLRQAHEILIANYYDPLPPDPALEYGMLRGMVAALDDPFTGFNEPAQHELQTDSLEGRFGGIGVRMERDEEGQVYLYPFPDSPADRAGVQPGDVLTAIDSLEVTDSTSMEAVEAGLRGPENTFVTLRIRRPPNGEVLAVEIEREPVDLPSVTWRIAIENEQIGVVEINLIAESTPAEIEKAVSSLERSGARYYILDLRGNGGGLLEAGVDCARLFLEKGIVIEQQYRDEEVIRYEVEEPGSLSSLPIVVWVNQGTASAAEIFAGALQASGRAPLIGTHTFGKNVIQLVFELRDGSSIQVSAARWWFPDWTFPNGEVGLLPDFAAASDSEYIDAAEAGFSP